MRDYNRISADGLPEDIRSDRHYRDSIKEMTPKSFFDDEEYAFLAMIAQADDEAAFLARLILRNEVAELEPALEDDDSIIPRCYENEDLARVVVLGLRFGVAYGDGACANYLGALHYLGNLVPQDYERARELYELAESRGVPQAIVNVGYIYEYGRCGEPDHLRAYMQYAKAAALFDHFEALYKLGDMYLRARVVPRDPHTAYVLYERSLREAHSIVAKAQPAFRIAELISDRANAEWNIPYDPLGALSLYQMAEQGLRIDIAHGQVYYRKRLQEAMRGQERMRAILDDPEFWRQP